MTTVAVFVDPPRSVGVLPALVDAGVVTGSEAADLYAAMARDVCGAVAASGADLLVNYAPIDRDDPTSGDPDEAAREEVREAIAPALDDPESVRFEVQVGSTFSARVGNTVTHLLDGEGVQSAAVVEPTAPLLERRHVDGAAMKLRESAVVLAPAHGGRVAFAAFRETVDFADAFAPPAVETLTDWGRDAGHDVDFIESLPVVAGESDLASVLTTLRARQRAEKWVPPHTAAAVADLGLTTEVVDGDLRVVSG